MTLQYASDLHLEMKANTEYLLNNPIKKAADILILAGDITYLEDSYLANKVLDQLSDTFDEVMMIPGNHEFYKFCFPIEKTFPEFEFKVRENIRYYNNRTVVRGDIRILFSTLFSKVTDKRSWQIEQLMSDFHVSKFYENSAEFNLTGSARLKSSSLRLPFGLHTLVTGYMTQLIIVSCNH